MLIDLRKIVCLTIISSLTFLFPFLVFADGWTTPYAKIEKFQANNGGTIFVLLDTSITMPDSNNCGSSSSNWRVLTGPATDSTKPLISLLITAYALGKKVVIYSNACDFGGNYNNISYIEYEN